MAKNTLFRKGRLLHQSKPYLEGAIFTRQNQAIGTKTIRKADFITTTRAQALRRFTTVVQHQMLNTFFIIQMETPLTSNLDLFPLIKVITMEHVDPIIRRLFTINIPKVS